MSRFDGSMPEAYFDALYAADPDPWRFAQSDYERHKYAATLAALPRSRYTSALEVGCSIGVLTRQLAPRCETLLSLDVAEAALAQARARCADFAGVSFIRARVPHAWPSGRYDLIMLSEVVYYLDAADVAVLANKVCASFEPGGDIVLVHWLGETNYPLSGDAAAEAFMAVASAGSRVLHQQRSDAFRLDVLRANG